MSDGFAAEERSYRRGLILGLTMAEIMVLVLFALLLILMVGVRELDESRKEASAAKKQTSDVIATNEQLREELTKLAESPDSANAFDDTFRELLLANEKITELQAETSGLRDARKILETVAGKSGGRDIENAVKKIEQQLQISDHLLKDMKVEGSGHDFPNDEELAKEASRLLSLLEELKAPDGWTPAAVMRMIAESKRNAEDSEARVRTLQGSLLNVQQRLTALGKGTERPACWANPDTGRPEYVFNVSLTANSVRIQDNALLSSQRDLVALPLAGVHFERPLGFNDFRDETRSLFQWSEKQGCRFFVRVVDETAAHEKAGYKLALRVVQERFYTFEGVNPSINEARQGRSIESSHAVSTHAPQVVSDAKTVVRAYECSRQMPRKTSPHAKRANLGRNHGALRSIRRGNADSGPGGCPVQTAPRGITGSPKTGE